MNDARLGIVRLEYAGRTIPLRFTWGRIDSVGRNGLTELLQKADSGDAGGLQALADLIEIGSGQALSAAEIMADPPAYTVAYEAVVGAWLLALYGPSREPEASSANPPNRLRTLFSRVFRRRTERG